MSVETGRPPSKPDLKRFYSIVKNGTQIIAETMDVHREVETSSEGTPSLRGGRWGEGVLSQSEEGCINLFPHFNEWSLWYAIFFYGICAAVTQAVIHGT